MQIARGINQKETPVFCSDCLDIKCFVGGGPPGLPSYTWQTRTSATHRRRGRPPRTKTQARPPHPPFGHLLPVGEGVLSAVLVSSVRSFGARQRGVRPDGPHRGVRSRPAVAGLGPDTTSKPIIQRNASPTGRGCHGVTGEGVIQERGRRGRPPRTIRMSAAHGVWTDLFYPERIQI